MPVPKIEAFRSLEAVIRALPDFVKPGSVVIDQAPPEKATCYPAAAIVHGRLRLRIEQESETPKVTADSVVVQVGFWEVSCQIRLTDATPYQRAEREDLLTQLFFQREGAPGVLVTDVTSCTDLGPFRCAWEIDDAGWEDEQAFTSMLWSVQNLSGQIPVLVKRNGIYTLNELYLGFSGSSETFTSADVRAGVKCKTVKVNSDGSWTWI